MQEAAVMEAYLAGSITEADGMRVSLRLPAAAAEVEAGSSTAVEKEPGIRRFFGPKEMSEVVAAPVAVELVDCPPSPSLLHSLYLPPP